MKDIIITKGTLHHRMDPRDPVWVTLDYEMHPDFAAKVFGNTPFSGTMNRYEIAEMLNLALASVRPKRIILNGPATIMLWDDGEKTVVKNRGERPDFEKALMACYLKRFCPGWQQWDEKAVIEVQKGSGPYGKRVR